jgi:hypothetical protein
MTSKKKRYKVRFRDGKEGRKWWGREGPKQNRFESRDEPVPNR